MITVTRIPTRTFINKVIILGNYSYKSLEKDINDKCNKYKDVDQSKFVSNVNVVISNTGWYIGTITISEELPYDMSDED